MKKFCVVATIKKLEQQPTKKEKKKIINNQKGEKKMKLKNIIQIGSFVVAGVAPVSASASDYMCLACPAGTYSNGGSTSCTPCPAGTYSNAVATSCTKCPIGTYSSGNSGSCKQCSDGYTSNSGATSCISLDSYRKWEFKGGVSDGNCQSLTLSPNITYLVYLRGADGKEVSYSEEYWDSRAEEYQYNDYTVKGGDGAFTEYYFTVDKQTSAQICAGSKGGEFAGSGGSWIKIGDKYIVAGGGAGAFYGHYSAGAGGAIGGGGSGGFTIYDNAKKRFQAGGKGGNLYAGGASYSGRGMQQGRNGDGFRSGGGRGGFSYTKDVATGGSVLVSDLFTGSNNSGVLGGQSGKGSLASHNRNLSLNIACISTNSGCAALYAFHNEDGYDKYPTEYENLTNAK